ncbi:MAG: hypothetical protein GF320_22910 [Armatimonadia bacterium]|nr:hypothetical protein [Armatimonadia bacterium]
MRTTVETLFGVFRSGRQIAVLLVSAAIYAGLSVALPDLEIVEGYPGLRPAVALIVALAIVGGAPAVWAAALGGLVIGLMGAGPLGRGIVGGLGEALAGFVTALTAWKTGWLLRARFADYDPDVRPGLWDVLWDCFLVGLASASVYTVFLAWLGEVTHVASFAYVAAVIGPNALVAILVLTYPLLMVLMPIARRADVVWRDPRGDAARVGTARVGRGLIWLGTMVAAAIGFALYAPEATSLVNLADPDIVQGVLVWVVQVPFILVMWIGALLG